MICDVKKIEFSWRGQLPPLLTLPPPPPPPPPAVYDPECPFNFYRCVKTAAPTAEREKKIFVAPFLSPMTEVNPIKIARRADRNKSLRSRVLSHVQVSGMDNPFFGARHTKAVQPAFFCLHAQESFHNPLLAIAERSREKLLVNGALPIRITLRHFQIDQAPEDFFLQLARQSLDTRIIRIHF